MEDHIEVKLNEEAHVDAKIVENESINLIVGEGKDFAQKLYVTRDRLGITYGNELEKLPYDLDPTDFLAMYTLKRGGI